MNKPISFIDAICPVNPANSIFTLMISWSGLDIGFDRGTTVGNYASPFTFSGKLHKVTVDLSDDQELDHDGVGRAEMARE